VAESVAQKPAHSGEPKPPWSCGSARFEESLDVDGHTLIVAVSCRFSGLSGEVQALLDTGAQWSILGGEMARALLEGGREAHEEASGDVSISTRYGLLTGRLHLIEVTLLADQGDALLVQSTVLLLPNWPGPPVLGYGGFLERIRIGLDPGDLLNGPRLFFGSDHDNSR
jgi:hypothetical protein